MFTALPSTNTTLRAISSGRTVGGHLFSVLGVLVPACLCAVGRQFGFYVIPELTATVAVND